METKYRGVNWVESRRQWVARINHEGRSVYIGHFKDQIEAAKEYDKFAIHFHADKAQLNFPGNEPPTRTELEQQAMNANREIVRLRQVVYALCTAALNGCAVIRDDEGLAKGWDMVDDDLADGPWIIGMDGDDYTMVYHSRATK